MDPTVRTLLIVLIVLAILGLLLGGINVVGV